MPHARQPPKYLMCQPQRPGKPPAWYVRRGRGRRIRLPGPPGSIGFEAAYLNALDELGLEHPDVAARRQKTPPLVRTTKPGYVYFLRCLSAVKIGFSINPLSRINSMRTSFSGPIETVVIVPGTDQDEQRLHEKFIGYGTSGEWFINAAPLIRAMARAAAYGHARYALDEEASPKRARNVTSTIAAE